MALAGAAQIERTVRVVAGSAGRLAITSIGGVLRGGVDASAIQGNFQESPQMEKPAGVPINSTAISINIPCVPDQRSNFDVVLVIEESLIVMLMPFVPASPGYGQS
jgi:hypothetical protein